MYIHLKFNGGTKIPEATKMEILENPTDKKFVWSIIFFCQLDFLIHAFLWPRNFCSRTPHLFHTLLFILHLVLFSHQWFSKQQLLAFIPKEEYYGMLENGVSASYFAYFFLCNQLKITECPKSRKKLPVL